MCKLPRWTFHGLSLASVTLAQGVASSELSTTQQGVNYKTKWRTAQLAGVTLTRLSLTFQRMSEKGGSTPLLGRITQKQNIDCYQIDGCKSLIFDPLSLNYPLPLQLFSTFWNSKVLNIPSWIEIYMKFWYFMFLVSVLCKILTIYLEPSATTKLGREGVGSVRGPPHLHCTMVMRL